MKKSIEKRVSLLLAVMMLITLMPASVFATDGEESITVESIEVVKGITLYENVNGTYYTTVMNNGVEEECEEYFVYNVSKDNMQFKVEFSDGTSDIMQGIEMWAPSTSSPDDEHMIYEFKITHNQREKGGSWNVGAEGNTMTISLAGASCTYNVPILENPVESISVAKAAWLIDGRARQYSPEYVDLEVTLKDGRVLHSDYNTRLSVHEDVGSQSIKCDYSDAEFTIGGNNTVTFSFMGKTVTHDVEIRENPVESIEVVESRDVIKDLELVEGTTGTNTYEYYQYGYSDVNVKINYKDGTALYSNYNGTVPDEYSSQFKKYESVGWVNTAIMISASSKSSVQNQNWTVGGNNEVTVSYLGVTTTHDANLIENPVEKVVVTKSPTPVFSFFTDGWEARKSDESLYEYTMTCNKFDGVEMEIHYKDGTTKTYTDEDVRVCEYFYGSSNFFKSDINALRIYIGDYRVYPTKISVNNFGKINNTFEYLGEIFEYQVELKDFDSRMNIAKNPEDNLLYAYANLGKWGTARADFFTGFLPNDDGLWYVKDGKVMLDTTGVIYDPESEDDKNVVNGKVVNASTDIMLKQDSSLTLDYVNSYVTDIQPTTTVETLKSNLQNDETSIQVVDKSGVVVERDYLATGDKVQLVDVTTVIDEKVIVVLGDTSGDGKVRAGDATKALNQIVDGCALAGPYLAAADASGDGKVRAGDATKILNYIVDGVALG